LTNAAIREEVRYLSWLDPLIHLVQNGDAQVAQQALRCIVNVTFDGHCRYMLVRSGAEAKISSARNRLHDQTVSQLADTAIKNFAVTVPPDVQSEVDKALSTGAVRQVSAPTAQKRAPTTNAFEGLDDLLGPGSSSAPPRNNFPPASNKPTSHKPSVHDPLDDLDDLLENVPAQVKTYSSAPSKSQQSRDQLDDLLNGMSSSNTQVRKSSQQDAGLQELDDLLGGISVSSSSRPSAAQSQKARDELDDLLSDFGSMQPKPSSRPSHAGGLDDIDALLSGMDSQQTRSSNYGGNKGGGSQGFGDIDSLLADIGAPRQSRVNQNTDDIDDLLSSFGSPPPRASKQNAGFSALDDLLNDFGS